MKNFLQSLIPELAIYGSKNVCTGTNNVLPPISEVSTRAVSLCVYTLLKGELCPIFHVLCNVFLAVGHSPSGQTVCFTDL